jgi:hypothetical protein
MTPNRMTPFADHGHYHGAHVILGTTLVVDPTMATLGEGGIHGG